MKYYLKQAILPFLYLIFVAITGFGVLLMDDNLMWLKAILCVLNLGLYATVICATSFKEGERAIKVRTANDLERREIIRTGEDRPLKIHEEYKPWKGFIIGFIACIPLIVLLIIHTFFLGTDYKGMGLFAGLLYLAVFDIFCLKDGTLLNATAGYYYFSLFAIPVLLLIVGVSYYMGGRRAELQLQKIKEKQKNIYGK